MQQQLIDPAGMDSAPLIPGDCSIADAVRRAYALQVVAIESSEKLAYVSQLRPKTRLGEDLGIPIEGRMRIVSCLRNAFGAQLAEPAATFPVTLGGLMRTIVPRCGPRAPLSG